MKVKGEIGANLGAVGIRVRIWGQLFAAVVRSCSDLSSTSQHSDVGEEAEGFNSTTFPLETVRRNDENSDSVFVFNLSSEC